MDNRSRTALLSFAIATAAGAPAAQAPAAPDAPGESVRVVRFEPGVTATIVEPAARIPRARTELILYALPNGNSTAETMGRAMAPGTFWRFDIQHIAAQTRALRTRGLPNAVVVYLEADQRSWPTWRSSQGYAVANPRIVAIVDSIRVLVGGGDAAVTLTGHSGGGSFAFGFLDGQPAIPDWLERIAFLDSNYGFEARHADPLLAWLARDRRHRLEVVAYDDREITLEGKKVVSDSGGTWRATQRMLDAFGARGVRFDADTLGPFERHRTAQIELLRHPNRENRILHTEMVGEMNAYMHVLLRGRPAYDRAAPVLGAPRAYTAFVVPAAP